MTSINFRKICIQHICPVNKKKDSIAFSISIHHNNVWMKCKEHFACEQDFSILHEKGRH